MKYATEDMEIEPTEFVCCANGPCPQHKQAAATMKSFEEWRHLHYFINGQIHWNQHWENRN
jgi:hypothetical protein